MPRTLQNLSKKKYHQQPRRYLPSAAGAFFVSPGQSGLGKSLRNGSRSFSQSFMKPALSYDLPLFSSSCQHQR